MPSPEGRRFPSRDGGRTGTCRPFWLTRAAAAALASIAVAQPTAAAAAPRQNDRRAAGAVRALAAQPCPDPPTTPALVLNQGELAYSRKGRYPVFGPTRVHLVPPVNWLMDPIKDRDWRADLQKLRFLQPLLASWTRNRNIADLRQALALGLDWIKANPRGGPTTSHEAWSGKVVGDRIPTLAYLGRAAACEGLLSNSDSTLFSNSMEQHAKFLEDPANHASDNHGLFVDIGLIRLGQLYPNLDSDGSWRALARQRFEKTLRGRLSDGVWLEHSTGYQFYVITAIDDFLAAYGTDPELIGLRNQMRAAALWFVEPDGRLTQFGDTDIAPIPHWAENGLPTVDGMKVFPGAGFAFVNARGSRGQRGYLAVTAGFHNLTHKHADDLSFELYDRGHRIVTDTGAFEKEPGRRRDFSVSSQAHSTITVDGKSLPITDPTAPYGSGIRAWGTGAGWYAIQAVDPLLQRQGVVETRTYLFRPNQALIVIDSVHAPRRHQYTRYVQLGPDVTATSSATGFTLAPFGGRITDVGVPTTFSSVRGSRDPLGGLTSPSFRVWRDRTTVSLADSGTDRVSATSISLGSSAVRATKVAAGGGRIALTLGAGSTVAGSLEIVTTGQTLRVRKLG